MAKQGSGGIAWTDETWNPVSGCTKVSKGCAKCYAERVWSRLSAPGQPYAGRRFIDVQCHPERLDMPLRWKKPRKVFVNSMSDLFHEAVPDSFIDQVFAVMTIAKRHQFQVLTKRPERMRAYMLRLSKSAAILDHAARTLGFTFKFLGQYMVTWPIPNIWLGVSAEDQAAADERIPLLLETPAAVRFVSYEPTLGPLDLRNIHQGGNCWINALTGDWSAYNPIGVNFTKPASWKHLDWLIVGSESGSKARSYDLDWFRSILHQCRAADVPLFVKQITRPSYGSKIPFESWPRDLQIREWPRV